MGGAAVSGSGSWAAVWRGISGSSLDGHAQLVAGGHEGVLDLVRGGGRGEDEAQVAVPVRERADRLADGDRDGQAGDPRYGGGVVAAVDGAQRARARTGSMYTPAACSGAWLAAGADWPRALARMSSSRVWLPGKR